MENAVKKVARKTITVRVTPEMHQQLKAVTKFKNLTIQSVVAEMVASFVSFNFTEDMLSDEEVSDLHPAE